MGHFTIIVVKTGRLYISLWGFNRKEKKAKRKAINNYKNTKSFIINFLKNMIFSTWKLVKNCN